MQERINRRVDRVGMALRHDPVALVCTNREAIDIAGFIEPTVDDNRGVFEELCGVELVIRLQLGRLTGQADEKRPGLRGAVHVVKPNQVRPDRRVSGDGGLVDALFVFERLKLDAGMTGPRGAWPRVGGVGCYEFKRRARFSSGGKNAGDSGRLGQAARPS